MAIKLIKSQFSGKLSGVYQNQKSGARAYREQRSNENISEITGIKNHAVVNPAFADPPQVEIKRYHDDKQAVR